MTIKQLNELEKQELDEMEKQVLKCFPPGPNNMREMDTKERITKLFDGWRGEATWVDRYIGRTT